MPAESSPTDRSGDTVGAVCVNAPTLILHCAILDRRDRITALFRLKLVTHFPKDSKNEYSSQPRANYGANSRHSYPGTAQIIELHRRDLPNRHRFARAFWRQFEFALNWLDLPALIDLSKG